jgi:hypothetical protein
VHSKPVNISGNRAALNREVDNNGDDDEGIE